MRDENIPPLNRAAPYGSNGQLEMAPPSHVARCFVNTQTLPSPAIVASIYNHYPPSAVKASESLNLDEMPESLNRDTEEECKTPEVARRRRRANQSVIYREMNHEVEHAATLSRAHSLRENTTHGMEQGQSPLQRRSTVDGYPRREPRVAPTESIHTVSNCSAVHKVRAFSHLFESSRLFTLLGET